MWMALFYYKNSRLDYYSFLAYNRYVQKQGKDSAMLQVLRKMFLVFVILAVSLFPVGRGVKIPERTEGFSWEKNPVIAHALGGLDETYLNSREGFLNMYQKGVRLFEVDLCQTSDQVWVCRHSWNDPMGQWEGNKARRLSVEEFKSAPVYGRYTPLTLEDLFVLLKEHPDAYVMLDSKQYSLRSYQRTLEDYSSYVELARETGTEEVLDQLIPEIYNDAMFAGTAMLYSFSSYIYSLWQEYSREELKHIAEFCKEHKIPAVTMYRDYWSEEGQQIFSRLGIHVYVYTVNDREEARNYMEKGAAGVCTDFLTDEDLW